MTEVTESTLDLQMETAKKKFGELETLMQQEVEKNRAISQNISRIREEMLRLDGEYRALEGLKGNGNSKDKPELKIPKAKK